MKKPERKRELDKPRTARTLTPAEFERARGGHSSGDGGAFLTQHEVDRDLWDDDWLAPV